MPRSQLPAGGFFGLFLTKDFGQNWTQVRIANHPRSGTFRGNAFNEAIPTNDISQPDYPILGGQVHCRPGQLRHRPDGRPDQPQHRLPGRLGRRRCHGLGPRRRHQDLGCARTWSAYANNANDGGRLDLASNGPATVND